MKLEGLKDTLATIADARSAPVARRNAALASTAAIDPAGSVATLGRMIRDAAEPVEVREQAAGLLVAAGKPESRSILVDALSTAPGRFTARPEAEALLDAVTAGKASARMSL